jgi:hypothetical protein
MDNLTTTSPLTPVIQRPRYYARQLVTPTELNLEASYFLDRLRRHNRLLHGWGVICGALVCRVADAGGGAQPWKVKITPGDLIDPYGNAIAILAERIVDLRSGGVVVGAQDPAGELSDPWCADVWTEPTAGTVWVAVKYHQSMARPVRIPPVGCSCDDSTCEYSRWCDGYQVGLLDQCPPSHMGDPPPLDNLDGADQIPVCLPEPDDPWVVLASVDVDDDGQITAIDNCRCRRMIVTLAHLWWRCKGSTPAITKVTVEVGGATLDEVPRGQDDVKVHIEGTNIDRNAMADLGQGIQVTDRDVPPGGTGMDLTVTVLKSAQPGTRNLTITNPDCAMASATTVLNVSPKKRPTATKASAPKRRRSRQT